MNPATRDHIVPLCHPDAHEGVDNLQPLCDFCNRSKQEETINWLAYRRLHGWVRTHEEVLAGVYP